MMLLLGYDAPLWTVLIVILLILYLWWSTATYGVFKRLGVPYVMPVPPLGSIYTALKPITDSEMDCLKKYGKVWGTFDGRTPNLIVADADMIKIICIKKFYSFTNRRKMIVTGSKLNCMISQLDDDHWKHVRGCMTPAFTSGKLKQMIPTINDCGDKLVAHIRETETEPFAVKDFASGYTMDVIASTALGIEIDSQKDVNHPLLKYGGYFFGSGVGTGKLTFALMIFKIILMVCLPKFVSNFMVKMGYEVFPKESLAYFDSVVTKVLDARKEDGERAKQKSTDFIQICFDKLVSLDQVSEENLRVTNGNQWTTEGMTHCEIVSNAVLLLIAGFESTAASLQFFYYHMAKSPEIQQKLFEHITEHTKGDNISYDDLHNMDYLDQCLNEILRMYPAAIRFDRETKEDTDVNGLIIPSGMCVSVSVYAIHHNPEYWSDPEVFNPDRFLPENKEHHHPCAFLPFGIGNRNCVAMRLALLEVKIAIIKTIKNFRLERTASTPERIVFSRGVRFMISKTPIKLSAVSRA